ncbi:type II toxin-antitoxin system VapC family toxin [Halosimplex litoreum]|uniref:Ribonuclease VapC n=1 Tax=Halosimplex litoreum TaxID=1198301 RepID=A0A7T3FVY0_9EURY|nr:type II toxin-antitoxin system VapC family toxin [Halosimplex litoreum]QPV61741.1 type II toxin-antitoxin system VapC family toxin [Halosimplex litoreum]
MYCLDANVWIYFLDADLDEHETVRDDVAEVLRSRPLFTTTVLQMEVVHYLTNQLADSERHVERVLSIEDSTVAELRPADVKRAAKLLAEYDQSGIGGRDATVLAAMERHGVGRLWTHDDALKRMDDCLDWLTVTDPVSE